MTDQERSRKQPLRCTRCGHSVPPPAESTSDGILIVCPACGANLGVMGQCEKGDRLRPGFCLVINEAHVQRFVSRRPARWPEPGASSECVSNSRTAII